MPAALYIILISLLLPTNLPAENFSDFEIRVIRPRYFNKKSRLEISLAPAVTVNQKFHNSFYADLQIAYHLSESFALAAQGAYGFSTENFAYNSLTKQGINTKILQSLAFTGLDLQWTPMYGKFQRSNAQVVYFDSYLSVGPGITVFDYNFKHCTSNNSPKDFLQPSPEVRLSLGQRFFISQDSSLKWNIQNRFIFADEKDSACAPSPSQRFIHSKISILFAYAYYI